MEARRAAHPNFLLLDAGDLFQGDWSVNASEGMGAVAAFELLGVDAAAIGNHEFDYGGTAADGGHPLRGALEAAARRAPFHWLSANITQVTEGGHEGPWAPEGISATAIVERAGVRIGLIGLTTVDTPQTTLARHVSDLRFRDPVETLRAELPKLRARGAQVVIVLGHLTGSCRTQDFSEPADTCFPDGEVGRLLTELPEGSFDVLVAGHAHALLASRFGKSFVLANRSRGQILGGLNLVVGPEGVDLDKSHALPPWELIHEAMEPGCEGGEHPLAPAELGGQVVTPTAEAVALVEQLEAEAGSLCQEVGCSELPFLRAYQSESPLGNLVSDALLAAFPGADLAVQNSGGLRADLPAGLLRRQDLLAAMPFPNRLLLLEMTGEAVERMFRLGSSGAHGILQVAGARYHFDPQRTGGTDLDASRAIEPWERDRLCSVHIGTEPLRPEQRYQVVTSDFLFEGGDHLGLAYADAKVLAEGPLLREALVAHVQAQEGCIGPAEQPAARIRTAPCSTPH